MKKCLFLLASALCAASCIYPFVTDLESEASETLVVDGNILVGGISTIQISYIIPLNKRAQNKATGYAWIEDDLGNRYYPSGEAPLLSDLLYIPTDGPEALNATSFRAVVEADGETYTSEWTTPGAAPKITDITFEADDRNVYVMANLVTGVDNPGYMGFLYEETWEFHADYMAEYEVDPKTWRFSELTAPYPYYWCYRHNNPMEIVLTDISHLENGTINDVPVLSFPRTDKRNIKKYSVLVKAFALSQEAYRYNKQMQDVSDQGGDLFSPDPGSMDGNLVCFSNPEREVMGMVLCGRVSSRRAFLDSRYSKYKDPEDNAMLGILERKDWAMFYHEMGYRPVKYIQDSEGNTGMGWGLLRCIDCIADGGTQEKPDYWED